MSGVMSVTGESDGEPLLIGVPVADFTGALVGAQAALLGLFAREKTGGEARANFPAGLFVDDRRHYRWFRLYAGF
jgi:formyl-CoA transferase/CoA:oxalate CoA-transferase